MGAVVTTDFRIKGKSLSRNDLNKIIQVLGISQGSKLPTGSQYKYVLVLETTAKVPLTGTGSRKKRI